MSVSPNDATEFQPQPAAGGTGAALGAGARVGPYAILGLLGEGGMGRVYRAEQLQPVRREVALKLIREQIASPLARAYFEVERQALAQMRHPAIAQVLDAGTTEDGDAWFAMELVDGVPITQFCRDEKLDLAQRLELFGRVCHGVQHAHQKGIIHRDLKPANVLVQRIDGVPAPKIIDFGIAIGGDREQDGQMRASAADGAAGTGVYMSPEQSTLQARDIDTRSDVYSLGVMLYEVLTGSDAVTLATAAHRSHLAPQKTLLAAIDSGADPRAARADERAMLEAAHRLPNELRCVLRRALAEDREQRYASVAALAEDLQRFRERRPLAAVPPTRGYLLRCFVARHRIGLAASTVAAIALVAGAALALHGLAEARRSAAAAQVEAVKAEQVAGFVQDMLSGIDPDRAKTMDRSLMRMVLDSAAQRAAHELTAQPQVRASIERTIANSYASLGEIAIAGVHFREALSALDAGGDASAGQRARLAIRVAENLNDSGQPQEALEDGRKVLASIDALPADDRDRLYVESHLASIETDAGKLEDARARFQRVLEAQTRTLGADDPETVESLRGLAVVDSNMARYDEARSLFETLIEHERKRYGDEHSRTLNAVNGLAVVDLEQRRFAEAEALLAPQLDILKRIFGPEHPRTLTVIGNLGGAIRQQGRNEEARPYYEQAYALSLKLFGPDKPRTVFMETNLASLLRDAGDLAEAEKHARSAAEHADVALRGDPYRAAMHRELATILTAERKFAEAEREIDIAWSIYTADAAYGPTHPRAQDVVDAAIDLYKAWGKPEREAEWQARKAVATAAK